VTLLLIGFSIIHLGFLVMIMDIFNFIGEFKYFEFLLYGIGLIITGVCFCYYYQELIFQLMGFVYIVSSIINFKVSLNLFKANK